VNFSYGDSLLKIDNISLNYGNKIVLRNVVAEIRKIVVPGKVQGQVVGFIGKSGCGKTSLFRIISGLMNPSSGQVILNGFNRPVHPGEVGVVAQSYPLFDHRTVKSNLMLAASRKEKDTKICHSKVVEFLNEFDLIKEANCYPAQLSGGQRQRVAILQQILCSSHFLLMDEPFSGLDMLMLEKTSALIQKVANMDNLNTIIIVSHDITTTACVADHLWLMGRDYNADGTPIPGSRIVETYDLIERGIAWEPEILTQANFLGFVKEVKERFRSL
jgi:ABC-type nitrate/sulfonate/bicarbonate transport system ATPase subunit